MKTVSKKLSIHIVVAFLLLFTVACGTSTPSAPNDISDSGSRTQGFSVSSSLDICSPAVAYLNTYNAITLGDLNTTSDIEGITFIGGNYISSSSATFGSRVHNAGETPVLFVAGEVVGGNSVNVENGSVVVSDINDVEQRNRVGWDINGRNFNLNGGNNGAVATVGDVDAETVASDILDWSRSLSEADANNSLTLPEDGRHGPAVINIESVDDGIAIFNTTADELFNSSYVQQIEISNASDAELIIINVAGESVEWRSGNMVGSLAGDSAIREKLVWNFYEAESITFQANMHGAVLAPNADVTALSNIDGTIVAESFTTNSEVHLPSLNFECEVTEEPVSEPTEVPEEPTEIPEEPVEEPTLVPTPTPNPFDAMGD